MWDKDQRSLHKTQPGISKKLWCQLLRTQTAGLGLVAIDYDLWFLLQMWDKKQQEVKLRVNNVSHNYTLPE